MIHFEIIQSPDIEVVNRFEFFQNQIHLGRKANHIHIKDSELLNDHLMIEVVEKDLLIHPQKGVEFFLINGKRATTVRKVKVGDQITIGSTLIKVLNFEETQIKKRKDILTEKLKTLMNENSPKLPVIEKLTVLSK